MSRKKARRERRGSSPDSPSRLKDYEAEDVPFATLRAGKVSKSRVRLVVGALAQMSEAEINYMVKVASSRRWSERSKIKRVAKLLAERVPTHG